MLTLTHTPHTFYIKTSGLIKIKMCAICVLCACA